MPLINKLNPPREQRRNNKKLLVSFLNHILKVNKKLKSKNSEEAIIFIVLPL
jgi:hypothetical protein